VRTASTVSDFLTSAVIAAPAAAAGGACQRVHPLQRVTDRLSLDAAACNSDSSAEIVQIGQREEGLEIVDALFGLGGQDMAQRVLQKHRCAYRRFGEGQPNLAQAGYTAAVQQ
jgi:hypothetical protein